MLNQKSESDLLVFISSVMDDELGLARDSTAKAIQEMGFGRPWAFEYTPASSEAASDAYLRKVEESDFVIWLVGSRTTQPVVNEVHRCLASQGRLLVFKFPADDRDEQTETLLQEAGRVVKWKDVADLPMLGSEITLALSDEIVRALRDPLGVARNQSLVRARDRSIADCLVSLLALGVAEDVANDLAYDRGVGHDLNELDPGLHVVTGPQGSGKTLSAHRLFQKAVERALKDSSEAFPILINAADLRGDLWETLDDRCRRYADPQIQPLMVIIDAVDERGAREATSLLRQMEGYANANVRSTLVATTRPLPNLDHRGTTLEIPTLNDDEVVELITKVSGVPLETIVPRFWERSLRESSKFPLFAVMIGVWLRDNPEMRGLSQRRLVEHLGQAAVVEGTGNSEETDRLLQVLAAKAITHGTNVRLYEVTPVSVKQRQLADSRLVHQSGDGADFALPIFREWYAARAVLEGTIAVEDIDLDSDRWAIPLSVAAHSDNVMMAQAVMKYLASTNPSVAADVLKEDEMNWYSGGTNPSLPTTAVGIGEKIRRAMGTWADGLGPLFNVIGPVNPEGTLATLGVEFLGNSDCVWFSWYRGLDQLAPVVEFTDDYHPFRHHPELGSSRDWPKWYGGGIPPTELWSWVNTKSHLVNNLTEALKRRHLSYEAPDAVAELVWAFALDFNHVDNLHQGPIETSSMLERIQDLLQYPWMTRRIGGNVYTWREIENVKDYLAELSADGQDRLFDPWPAADLQLSSPSIWSRYSDQRLLERTMAVYTAALRIYQAMVERWLPSFVDRLSLYRLMPVRIEGSLSRLDGSGTQFPLIEWRPMIIPDSERSHVYFAVKPERTRVEPPDDYFAEQRDAFTSLRQGDAERLVLFWKSSALDGREPRPATKLAYEWLHHELRRLRWAK